MSLHAYYKDAWGKSAHRQRVWFKNNLLNVLAAAKEKQARDIDASIVLAEELMRILDEKVHLPTVVPPREVEQFKDDSLMKPIPDEVLDILYKSSEKGSTEKYLKARYKNSPEDNYFFRIVSSWDYGWQQKSSRQRCREVNRGRCAILRDTFYRKNNLAPDPKHYATPSGGEFSVCSQYSCNFN